MPIFPLGVLQLGSLEPVRENLSSGLASKSSVSNFHAQIQVVEDPRLVDIVADFFSTLQRGSSIQDYGFVGTGCDLLLDRSSWGSMIGEICEDGVNGQYVIPDITAIPNFSPEVNLIGEMNWAFGEEPLLDLMGSELDQLLGSTTWFSSGGLPSSPSQSELANPFGKPDDLDHLLNSSIWITELLESSEVGSPSNSDDQFVGSCLTHVKSEVDQIVSPMTPHFEPSLMSPSESQTRSGGSVVLDEEHTKQSEKKTGSPFTGREKTRPRPRDRQLIQDRIKELRELVPNASKVIIMRKMVKIMMMKMMMKMLRVMMLMI